MIVIPIMFFVLYIAKLQKESFVKNHNVKTIIQKVVEEFVHIEVNCLKLGKKSMLKI